MNAVTEHDKECDYIRIYKSNESITMTISHTVGLRVVSSVPS